MSAAGVKARLRAGHTVWGGVAHDGLTARLAARAGFELVCVSGYGVAAALGYPDVGLVTMTEMVSATAVCVRASGLPVMVDADTGFGNATNVWRTVRELEQVGAAGLQIEDQVAPKRCPFLEQNALVPMEEAAGKVRAAVAARSSPDFLVAARTDARDPADALARACAYAAAGADFIYVTNALFKSAQDLRAFRIGVGRPISFSLVGWTEELSAQEIDLIGGALVFWPFVGLMTAAQAIETNFAHLRRHRSSRGLPVQPMAPERFAELMDHQVLSEWQRRFGNASVQPPGLAER